MIKLIETTTFKDEDKPKETTEKQFHSLAKLHQALDRYGIKNHIKCDLKKNKKCELKFQDATTVIEIVEPIILTDAK